MHKLTPAQASVIGLLGKVRYSPRNKSLKALEARGLVKFVVMVGWVTTAEGFEFLRNRDSKHD